MDKKKVLLIEDDADLQEALVGALGEAGYLVLPVSESETALKGLDVMQPDAAVVDLFTGSIHGLHFVERVRAHATQNDLPIIVLTNNEHEEHRQKAEALGVADYLIKVNTPIADVVAAVDSVLQNGNETT